MPNRKRKIRSTIPGYVLTPKGDFYQAKKIGTSGERIKKDPAYDITRKNAADFGKAAKLGKVIRDAFRQHAPISNVTPAMTKVLRQVLNTDRESLFGNRTFLKADFTALTGFQFNPGCSFQNRVGIDLIVEHQPEKEQIQLTIPAFDPVLVLHDESLPSHYRIAFVCATINLLDNTCVSATNHTTIIPRKHIRVKQHRLTFHCEPGNQLLFILAGTLEYYEYLPGSKVLVKRKCEQPLTVINTLHGPGVKIC